MLSRLRGPTETEAGIAFFKRYDQLSFTDEATVAVMKDKGINLIYSFDSGFDAVPGIVRLIKPLV